LQAFAQAFEDNQLFGRSSLVMTNCLGPCGNGPVVGVMPDNVWYQRVDPAIAKRIVAEHILEDRPVREHLMPDAAWG